MPGPQPPQSVSVLSQTVSLTDAEIKTLPSAAVEIVPAPGAGKIIIPIYAVALADFTAGAYTTVPAGASWQLMLGAVEWGTPAFVAPFNNQAISRLVQLMPAYMAPGTGDFSGVVITGIVSGVPISDFANAALSIKDDYNGVSNYVGGHVDNTLKVYVIYTIINV